jgi:hypothetical protein
MNMLWRLQAGQWMVGWLPHSRILRQSCAIEVWKPLMTGIFASRVTTQPALTPFLNAHRAIPLSQSGRGTKNYGLVTLLPTWEKGLGDEGQTLVHLSYGRCDDYL